MLKQNRFFSIIYICGTGLAIAMVMVLTLLYYFRTANIEPESFRNRMLVIKNGKIATKQGDGYGSSQLSYTTIKECFYPMQLPETVSAVVPIGDQNEIIQLQGGKDIYNGIVMGTDAAFWKIFQFTFLSGKPYTEEDFRSGIRKAVLCETYARKLFNTSEATGKTFLLNFEEYTVAGIIKNVPSITGYCYSEIWIPFTSRPSTLEGGAWCDGILGPMNVYILAKNSQDFEPIRQEAKELCKKYNTTTVKYDFVLNDQPDSVIQAYIREGDSWNIPDFTLMYIRCALILLILLLVPAINLTGMTSSRMKKRMEELGVRKTFGASNNTLLVQILYENMLLTLLGGVVGLLFSYGLVYTLKSWLLGQYNWDGESLYTSIDLSPGMLLNPSIFGYTFLFCLILNLSSALLPALRALRRPIIEALNDK